MLKHFASSTLLGSILCLMRLDERLRVNRKHTIFSYSLKSSYSLNVFPMRVLDFKRLNILLWEDDKSWFKF